MRHAAQQEAVARSGFGHSRVQMLGAALDRVDEQHAVDDILSAAADRRGGWTCSVNLDILRQQSRSTEVRELLGTADLALADGMPIVWASRIAGAGLPGRVAGSSMIHAVVAGAAERGIKVFFLGGAGDSAHEAAEVFQRRHSEMTVIGTHSPPFGFEEDPAEMARIEAVLTEANADIVFVGLGCPKQERLIAHLRQILPNAWFLASGVSFSFVTGEVRRAPGWMQRLGLEWLTRLVQEPGRLYRRYLIDGLPFLARLMAHALSSRLRRGGIVAID